MSKKNSFPLLIAGLALLVGALFFFNQSDDSNKSSDSNLDSTISELNNGVVSLGEESDNKRKDIASEELALAKRKKEEARIKRERAAAAQQKRLNERIARDRERIKENIAKAKVPTVSPEESLSFVGRYLFETVDPSSPTNDLIENAKQVASSLLEKPGTDSWLLSEAENLVGKSTLRPQDKILEYWALSKAYESIGILDKSQELSLIHI